MHFFRGPILRRHKLIQQLISGCKIIEQTKASHAPDKRLKLVELAQSDVSTNTYTLQTSDKEIQQLLSQDLNDVQGNFLVKLLPDESVGSKVHGVVNLSVANLRTKPDHAAEMATQVLLGAQVDILQKDGGDYRVRTPEGYIAWVPTSSIVALDAAGIADWKKGKKSNLYRGVWALLFCTEQTESTGFGFSVWRYFTYIG